MKHGSGEMSASPAVWAGDTLYISGLTGIDPSGRGAPDLDKQVRGMGQAATEILTAAGLSLEDIVSGTVYLRDITDYAPFNDLYKEFFTKGPGVRTCLMPGTGVEKNDVRARASFIAARTRLQ
jgi:enamine deaminase RidA (YjgF/YER057c/UK114 family)